MLHVLKGFDVAASLQFLLKSDHSRDVLIAAGQDHHWYRHALGVYWVKQRWMALRGCLEDGVGTRYERCNLSDDKSLRSNVQEKGQCKYLFASAEANDGPCLNAWVLNLNRLPNSTNLWNDGIQGSVH